MENVTAPVKPRLGPAHTKRIAELTSKVTVARDVELTSQPLPLDLDVIRRRLLGSLAAQLDETVDRWAENLSEDALVLMGPGGAAKVVYPPIDRTTRLCVECHEFSVDCECKPEIIYGFYSEPNWWSADPSKLGTQDFVRADQDMLPVVEHFSHNSLIEETMKRLGS